MSKQKEVQKEGLKILTKKESGRVRKKTIKKRKVAVKKVKRKNYSSTALQRAIEAVNDGKSFREAAYEYQVPLATIHRKIKNPDTLKSKSGPPTVLFNYEEQEIVDWIKYRAERANLVTKTILLDCVQHYIRELNRETPFKDDQPGRHWYEGFFKRHSDLSIRTAQHLTLVRASVTTEDLFRWFAEIETYLRGKNLVEIDSSRIFNCDETNIQFCPKPDKVITEKGARTVYKVTDASEKESLTTLFMYSADGTRAPPMLMYPYKERVPTTIIKNVPLGWGIGLSDNGWMTIESFYEYITNVFYPWLLKIEVLFPVLLYLDGHLSHVTVPLVSFCREKKIEVIALFPNSTHIMQPLDIAFFHPFKDAWKKTIQKWKAENNNMRLRREHFASVLMMTLNSFTEEGNVVKNGFKAAGLMPFNPQAINYDILKKKKRSISVESEQCLSNVTVIEGKRRHLEDFEKNLPVELLEDFKRSESIGLWTGDVPNEGLFDYYLQIKTAATGISFFN